MSRVVPHPSHSFSSRFLFVLFSHTIFVWFDLPHANSIELSSGYCHLLLIVSMLLVLWEEWTKEEDDSIQGERIRALFRTTPYQDFFFFTLYFILVIFVLFGIHGFFFEYTMNLFHFNYWTLIRVFNFF